MKKRIYALSLLFLLLFTACKGRGEAVKPEALSENQSAFTEKTSMTHAISPTGNSTTTTYISKDDIPSVAVLLMVTDAKNMPVIGAEVYCDMPPDASGDQQAVVEIVGVTNENGLLVWCPSNFGDRMITVMLQGKKLYEAIHTIGPKDIGSCIELHIA